MGLSFDISAPGTVFSLRHIGPMADGRVDTYTRGLESDLLDRVAAYAVERVAFFLDQDIRHPTPYYETQVRIDRSTHDRSVNDSGVVYGSWLEGTSPRNSSSTFKGYRAFGRAAGETSGQVESLTRNVIDAYVSKVG